MTRPRKQHLGEDPILRSMNGEQDEVLTLVRDILVVLAVGAAATGFVVWLFW